MAVGYSMAMSEPRKREGKVVHPRLPDDLYEEIVTYAQANERSVTNAIVYLLRRGLDAERGRASDIQTR